MSVLGFYTTVKLSVFCLHMHQHSQHETEESLNIILFILFNIKLIKTYALHVKMLVITDKYKKN